MCVGAGEGGDGGASALVLLRSSPTPAAAERSGVKEREEKGRGGEVGDSPQTAISTFHIPLHCHIPAA